MIENRLSGPCREGGFSLEPMTGLRVFEAGWEGFPAFLDTIRGHLYNTPPLDGWA